MHSNVDSNASHTPPGTPPVRTDSVQKASRLIDFWTLAVLLIAGVAAGTLSALGAHAMFQSGWAIAIAFALTVQIVTTLSLWCLPRTPLLRRFLLLMAWAFGATCSVGSAYYTSYQSSSQEVVAELRDAAVQSLALVKANLQAAKTNAVTARAKTREETARGTFSGGLAGYGPAARKLSQAAVEAQGKAAAAMEVEKDVNAALESLRHESLSAQAIRDLYTDTIARSGEFAKGVPAPDFRTDRRSYTAIVFSAFTIALGKDPAATPAERTRVLGSLGTASILEILALVCSLIRMELSRETRLGGGRGGGLPARVVSLILDIASMPDQLRDSWLVARLRGRAATLYRADRWRQAGRDFVAATQGQSPEVIWMMSIQAQAAAQGTSNIRKVIASLLPALSLSRLRLDAKVDPGATCVFDARVFVGKPFITHAALITGVIVRRRDGMLGPGPQWDAWIRFLVTTSGPPPARAAGRPKLRVVGAR